MTARAGSIASGLVLLVLVATAGRPVPGQDAIARVVTVRNVGASVEPTASEAVSRMATVKNTGAASLPDLSAVLARAFTLKNTGAGSAPDLSAALARAQTLKNVGASAPAGAALYAISRSFSVVPPGEVSAVPEAPAEQALSYRLLPPRPNPANPVSLIAFELPAAHAVTLAVYGLDGRRVRTLLAQQMAAGRHQVAWDGLDDARRAVASGVYFYRLDVSGWTFTRRLALIR